MHSKCVFRKCPLTDKKLSPHFIGKESQVAKKRQTRCDQDLNVKITQKLYLYYVDTLHEAHDSVVQPKYKKRLKSFIHGVKNFIH